MATWRLTLVVLLLGSGLAEDTLTVRFERAVFADRNARSDLDPAGHYYRLDFSPFHGLPYAEAVLRWDSVRRNQVIHLDGLVRHDLEGIEPDDRMRGLRFFQAAGRRYHTQGPGGDTTLLYRLDGPRAVPVVSPDSTNVFTGLLSDGGNRLLALWSVSDSQRVVLDLSGEAPVVLPSQEPFPDGWPLLLASVGEDVYLILTHNSGRKFCRRLRDGRWEVVEGFDVWCQRVDWGEDFWHSWWNEELWVFSTKNLPGGQVFRFTPGGVDTVLPDSLGLTTPEHWSSRSLATDAGVYLVSHPPGGGSGLFFADADGLRPVRLPDRPLHAAAGKFSLTNTGVWLHGLLRLPDGHAPTGVMAEEWLIHKDAAFALGDEGFTLAGMAGDRLLLFHDKKQWGTEQPFRMFCFEDGRLIPCRIPELPRGFTWPMKIFRVKQDDGTWSLYFTDSPDWDISLDQRLFRIVCD